MNKRGAEFLMHFGVSVYGLGAMTLGWGFGAQESVRAVFGAVILVIGVVLQAASHAFHDAEE